jgi:carbamoyl-phosphate synthase large subunit
MNLSALMRAKRLRNNILISSAGAKIPLIALLEKSSLIDEVWAADSNPEVLSSYFAHNFLTLPATTDENHLEIISTLLKHKITCVIPTRDSELPYWAANRMDYESAGISVLVSSPESINKSLDKILFWKELSAHGVSCIQTSESHFDIEADALVVKERFGAGSKNLTLNVSHGLVEEVSPNFDSAIFQPYVKGREFSVDTWRSRDGKFTLASPRWRTYTSQGESKVTKLFTNSIVAEIAKRVAEILLIEGPCVIQGFVLDSGEIQIIECNARVGGATTASIYAGAPLVDLSILEITTGISDSYFESISIKPITQIRYQIDKII